MAIYAEKFPEAIPHLARQYIVLLGMTESIELAKT
jgi:hypothetical protein